MLPYYVVAGVSALLAELTQFTQHRATRNKPAEERPSIKLWLPFDFAIVAVLISFSALRYNVGTDYRMYTRFYETLNPAASWTDQIQSSPQELGYTVLSLILRSAFNDPIALMWTTAIITILPIYAVIRRRSKNLTVSVTLFIFLAFYVAPFNIIRQGIAISLVFLAYDYLKHRRSGWIPFLLLSALAATFHASAIAVAALLLIARHWRPRPVSIIVTITAAAAMAGTVIYLPSVRQVLLSINDRYDTYLSSENIAGIGSYLTIAFYLVLLAAVYLQRKNVEGLDLLAFLVIAIVFLIVGTQVVAAGRLYYYFAIFLVLLVPEAYNIKNTQSRILESCVVVAAGIYFAFYLSFFGGLVPYQSIL